MKPAKTLGQNINAFLGNRKWSIKKLTDEICKKAECTLSERAVQKWISGETFPETDKLIILSELMGKSIDELLKTNVEDFPEYYSKTINRLSPAAQEALFHLCKDLSEISSKDQSVSAFYELFCTESTSDVKSDDFYTFQEAEQKYKTYYANLAKKERTDVCIKDLQDKNLSPSQCIDEYLKYTDIAVTEAPDKPSFEDYRYRFGKYDNASTPLEKFFGENEKEEIPHPTPAENLYYYTWISNPLYEAAFLSFSSSNKLDERTKKNIFDKLKKETELAVEKHFGELVEKGILEPIFEDNIIATEVVEFTDQYWADNWERDEFAVMDFCKCNFKITLTKEELKDFLCDYYRKTLDAEEE